MKVQIFEKKVDSYKKMNHQLTSTVDYIKVRIFSCCLLAKKSEMSHTAECTDFIECSEKTLKTLF